jgi:hypothetical protein
MSTRAIYDTPHSGQFMPGEPSSLDAYEEDCLRRSPLCGWCFSPLPPGEFCFCGDVCYAACKTDQFGEASGRRLAREVKVEFSKVLRAWRTGPWFCKSCGSRPVALRLHLCATCAPVVSPLR